ncbi:MAG: 1-acyl-sn-glycerol-3-phosphate acyltransferase [Clostridia bacterium]|nr:1-acyl-sn-glycerol-3-phosphate acyltransferase [Clostridia bacterium]
MFKRALRDISAFLATTAFSFRYRLEVVGVDRVPKEGGVLICANHKKAEDPILLYKALHKGQKRFIYFFAKQGLLKNRFVTWYLTQVLGIRTVSHSAADLGSIKWGLSKLKNGEIVGIFPEGTRNRTDAELLEFQKGAAIIAHMSKTQVVTATISGTRKWFSKCRVEFSEPLELAEFYARRLDDEVKDGITQKIYERIHSDLNK